MAYNPTERVLDEKKLVYESPKGNGQSHGNGYNLQKFTTNDKIKWQVLNVNKQTGEIVLISEKQIQTDDGKDFCLKGATGYLYAQQELNEICKIYGYGKGADTTKKFTYEIGDTVDGLEQKTTIGSGARSINFEDDIKNITGYNSTPKYTATKNMYYPTMLQPTGVSTVAKNQTRLDTCYVYNASDYLNTSDKIYKILFQKGSNYWLANRCEWTNEEGKGANFFCRTVNEGKVTAALNLAIWGNIEDGEFAYGVRPIVYLKANIKTSGQNENGEWEI